MVNAAELTYDQNATADQMAEEIFGDGVKIVEASYTGDPLSSAVYSNGDSVAADTTPSDTGVILSTGHADDYTNSTGEANQATNTSTNTDGVDGVAELDDIAGSATFDAAIFEAKFIPDGDILTMQFMFSSEEYLEYVNAGFNDAFGVFVNGEEVKLSVGDGEVTINNINDAANENLFRDNLSDQMNSEMDGVTLTLSMKATVKPGQENSIKIMIADGGDSSYDSNVLIAGDSVQTIAIAVDDKIKVKANEEKELDVLANDLSKNGELKITHINGEEVEPGDTVVLPNGNEITLNKDGTLTVKGDDTPDNDSFTYKVVDEAGNSDVGLVSMQGIMCFAAGTLIDVAGGQKRVEDLRVGDMVWTQRGLLPLRWTAKAQTIRLANHAPVVFEPGAIGNSKRLTVSPQHRFPVTGAGLEMLFGEIDALVAAKHLVNGDTIWRDRSGAPVTYVHILFDHHELVRANGCWSESYHPGHASLATLNTTARAELFDIFPALERDNAAYGPTVFPSLKAYEAEVFLAAG
ncbi:MAG: choice-of-anchor L domain-containing protein [Pseudomonadota bacterium]